MKRSSMTVSMLLMMDNDEPTINESTHDEFGYDAGRKQEGRQRYTDLGWCSSAQRKPKAAAALDACDGEMLAELPQEAGVHAFMSDPLPGRVSFNSWRGTSMRDSSSRRSNQQGDSNKCELLRGKDRCTSEHDDCTFVANPASLLKFVKHKRTIGVDLHDSDIDQILAQDTPSFYSGVSASTLGNLGFLSQRSFEDWEYIEPPTQVLSKVNTFESSLTSESSWK